MFAWLLVGRVVFSLFFPAVLPLMDSLCVRTLTAGAQGKKMYGRERLWGAVSWAAVHLCLGLLFDVLGTWFVTCTCCTACHAM